MLTKNHAITKKIFYSIALLLLVSACSSVPNTQYYSLLAQDTIGNNTSDNINLEKQAFVATNKNAIGIGPLVIPDMLDNFGIVSIKDGNKITLATYHLWAGNLKLNMTQVLADNISSQLNNDRVWPFPWDNRNRPKIQVRIVLEKFIGELGKEVTLQAKWTLLDEYGRKELQTKKSVFTQSTLNDSHDAYVNALNQTLSKLSQDISTTINALKL